MAKNTLDLSALSATDAELPARERAGKAVDSPFVGWLTESQENGTGKAVTVPGASVKEVVYLIRQAANHLNIGSRIVVTDKAGNVVRDEASEEVSAKTGKPKRIPAATVAARNPRQNFTVKFAAKARKSKSNGGDETDADETAE